MNAGYVKKEMKMNGNQVIPFEFEGKEYQIRVISDGATIYIRGFCDGRPANGYEYRINVTTAFDLKKLIRFQAITHLVELAKDDIRNKRWDRLLEAIATTKGAGT